MTNGQKNKSPAKAGASYGKGVPGTVAGMTSSA